MKSSKESLPRTGEAIVIDIGTGDGRFVSAMAKANPNKFFIGVDANVKPPVKPSMKATRKSAKGGLPNAMFVQAAVEDLPEEFNCVADEIHIHFPWGSLLKAVALGDAEVLSSLYRVAANDCVLEVVIGVDPVRDKAEFERLGVPEPTLVLIHSYLIPKYASAGFEPVGARLLDSKEWSKFETSWARKLSGNEDRTVFYMIFRRK